MRIKQGIEILGVTMVALIATSCSFVHGIGSQGEDGSSKGPGGDAPSAGALVSVSPIAWVRLGDVTSRVEIVEVSSPRYETSDGLRPLDPSDTDGLRRYQIAIARVQHDFVPATASQFAFVVNNTLDGEYDPEWGLGTIADIETGDTGIIFGGILSAGSRGLGAWKPYYDPDWVFPVNYFPDIVLRETVIALRQGGQTIEALQSGGWCEISNGVCTNTRTGWSSPEGNLQNAIDQQVSMGLVGTPGPDSSYP